MAPVVLACFFLSGASGLILELLWTRMLTLVFRSTTLMGATLPILSRAFVSRPHEIGQIGLRLGTLYAVNLFGAVAGSFLAGFVLLPMAGVRATNLVAACFDLGLAAAILVARR